MPLLSVVAHSTCTHDRTSRDPILSVSTTTHKMTGRGKASLPPPRPTTPIDPTLTSRPVPRKRAFPIRSFGPGTSIDTSAAAFNNWNGYELQAYWTEFHRVAAVGLGEDMNENARLLQDVRSDEAISYREDETFTPQPTWGYYVFLTDYDQATRDSLSRAMENWVEVTRRAQHAGVKPPNSYADEVVRRFKLDLVDEQDTLESASIDRVRACFRAHIRSLELTDDDADYPWIGSPHKSVCFVLNAEKVQMLANLTFREDGDYMAEFRVWWKCWMQAVDVRWERPETTHSKYRGVRDIDIASLGRAYILLEGFNLEGYNE
jgi:hypothetical protein